MPVEHTENAISAYVGPHFAFAIGDHRRKSIRQEMQEWHNLYNQAALDAYLEHLYAHRQETGFSIHGRKTCY